MWGIVMRDSVAQYGGRRTGRVVSIAEATDRRVASA
jgi:hypothetical protein